KDIRGIVQLVHGKNEHKGRYIAFMRFLASNGFLTIINDHRGHGESIIDP
ncbi:MAG: alpha/beta hydrolase, partial [Ruminococcus sp.]|nr:alpha/beta hydrolase [Ruminococcus sp.]